MLQLAQHYLSVQGRQAGQTAAVFQGRESVFLSVLVCSVKGLILLLKTVTIAPLISLEERSGNMSKVLLLSTKWNKRGAFNTPLFQLLLPFV